MPGFSVCRSCAVPHTVGCENCRGWGTRAGRALSVADAIELGTERCIVCTANHTGVAPTPVGICEQNTAPKIAEPVRRVRRAS